MQYSHGNIAIYIASFGLWRLVGVLLDPLWGYVAPVPVLLVFVSVAMLTHLDQCSEQLKTLKRAFHSLAKTGSSRQLIRGSDSKGSPNEPQKLV